MSVRSRTRSLAEIDHKIVDESRIIEETLTRLVAAGRPLSVLEVGFGWGRALTELAWMFHDHPIEFHGVDIDCKRPVEHNEDLREIARKFGIVPEPALAGFRVPQLHFYDATRLHFADESIDLIYSAVAIRFFERKAEFLEEVCRVLRPGGVALLQMAELDWNYPYGLANDDENITPYLSRMVLMRGTELIPVPAYFSLFEGDTFRFRFTIDSRCSIIIEKFQRGRLTLGLEYNAGLSGPTIGLPSWQRKLGKPKDGFRSVYDIPADMYRALVEQGLLRIN